MAAAATAAGQSGWTAFDQLGVQITGMGATIALAAVGTLLICIIVEKSIGLRLSETGEIDGLDLSLHGEHGYDLIGS